MTENELIEALQAALGPTEEGADGAFTSREIKRAMGWSGVKTDDHIRELIEAEKLEVVRVKRLNRVGVLQPVWAYRIKNG